MIEIKNLTYSYPDTDEPVLHNISFSLAKGDILLLAGGAGSGKSTLCYALGGFVPHFYKGEIKGDVLLDGHSMRETPLGEWLHGVRVGLVLQNPFNQISGARMTVFEEVAFGLENLGVPRDEMRQRVEAVLEQLGIADLADRSPYALSGGQMQRVAIASILVLEPKLLVLDEPTAQLDPLGTQEVFAVLGKLAKQGTTIVIATHKLAAAASFASHALVLHQGSVARFSHVRTVLSDLRLPYWHVEPPIYVPLAARFGLEPPYPTTFTEAISAFTSHQLTPTPTGQIADQWPFTTHTPRPEESGGVSLHNTGPMRLQQLTASLQVPLHGRQAFASSMPVTIENLHFTYPNGVHALRGVSLQLRPGKIAALIGSNGAGKSTLSRTMNGLLRPTKGTVRIGFWNVLEYPTSELARWVGYLFQNPDEQLFKSTVRKEVSFGPENFDLEEEVVQAAVNKALKLTGLTDVADAHPYDLHPTSRRWVALASVLAQRAPVLILDEPTSGLDLEQLQRMAALLYTLKTASYTLLLISHDMQFVAEHADYIYVMAQGKIITEGTPTTVFANQNALKQAGVSPPPVARLARALGFGEHVVSVSGFVDAVKGRIGNF